VVSGVEVIGYSPLEKCSQKAGGFDVSSDIGFFADKPENFLTFVPGEFAVFFPARRAFPTSRRGETQKSSSKGTGMKKYLYDFIKNAASLYLAVLIMPGISADGFGSIALAAIVTGVFNSFLRPVLLVATLPITIMSLGVFTFFINGFLLYLVPKVVKGFYVNGFWHAFLGALFIGFCNIVIDIFFRGSGSFRVGTFRNAGQRPAEKKHEGVIIDAEIVEKKEEPKQLS